MALPNRTRPSLQHSQILPSGSFHKPLILIHQRADRMKNTITENKPNWSHGPQPCLTQWNYEPCHVVPLKMDRSWWRLLTKHGPLEKRMANHFSILALITSWKRKEHLEKTIIQKNRCTPKFTAAILNREDTLATKMSIDRGKDTEVVYIYNGILLTQYNNL